MRGVNGATSKDERGNMAEYIIHTCLDREWYVRDYLVPSMLEQGIKEEQIEVWLDAERWRCLLSCMKCFEYCGKKTGGRWHLQDDVMISSDFKEKTEHFDNGIVAGFYRREWQHIPPKEGVCDAVFLWNSFQCIRIPDEIAGECAKWFFTDAAYRDIYLRFVEDKKADDSMFWDFIQECHGRDKVMNLNPSIVEHIDFLIGGSVINKDRGKPARGDYWEDTEAFDKMKDKLARR